MWDRLIHGVSCPGLRRGAGPRRAAGLAVACLAQWLWWVACVLWHRSVAVPILMRSLCVVRAAQICVGWVVVAWRGSDAAPQTPPFSPLTHMRTHTRTQAHTDPRTHTHPYTRSGRTSLLMPQQRAAIGAVPEPFFHLFPLSRPCLETSCPAPAPPRPDAASATQCHGAEGFCCLVVGAAGAAAAARGAGGDGKGERYSTDRPACAAAQEPSDCGRGPRRATVLVLRPVVRSGGEAAAAAAKPGRAGWRPLVPRTCPSWRANSGVGQPACGRRSSRHPMPHKASPRPAPGCAKG